jgi:hypothetical protein
MPAALALAELRCWAAQSSLISGKRRVIGVVAVAGQLDQVGKEIRAGLAPAEQRDLGPGSQRVLDDGPADE